ncbi:carboxypeptidase-like regulatory domain-containing protein [Nostoc sp. TCL26-01]|uniref:carboxypeptidase-like regulatory domain-containing protein n=1 Tax=Nostoc sp. TCL26-01 TaxID=2576904 RepID=UPI0015C0F97B|nr:carboxypeptidase-like regulatory domain-containing protein [Nostoc sp. TCL26-01]QLE58016.1 carboxypeptidase regulatory-like domain-containing protein [Nostoc sp. TCL26-01]
MLELSIVNQQIAIAGRVLQGETNKHIAGVIVAIVEVPEKYQNILSLKALQYGGQWAKMSERPDRKITAYDGYFYFTNLPPGEYLLAASLPNSSTQYAEVRQEVQVSAAVDGRIPTTQVDIVFLPTLIPMQNSALQNRG